MAFNFKKRISLALCLTTVFVMSEVFMCPYSFSQETNNTFIPYNLRGDFDESDYFSSSAEDLPELKNNSLDINKMNFPTPSQYSQTKLTKNQEKQVNVFLPNPSANSFFSPLEEDI